MAVATPSTADSIALLLGIRNHAIDPSTTGAHHALATRRRWSPGFRPRSLMADPPPASRWKPHSKPPRWHTRRSPWPMSRDLGCCSKAAVLGRPLLRAASIRPRANRPQPCDGTRPGKRPVSAAAEFHGGTPGARCALFVEGQMFGLVRRDGRQFNVWLVGSQGQHFAAVCSSYALARAALGGLVPAQDQATCP